MPTKTIYITEADLPIWDEAMRIAKRHGRSRSKIITDSLRTMVRERQGDTGVPLGVPIPSSMKDPALVARERTADAIADHVRTSVLQALEGEEL